MRTASRTTRSCSTTLDSRNKREGHYVEALQAMHDYVSDASAQLTPARRAEVAEAISRLEARIGTLVVAPSVSAFEAHIDGVPYDGAAAQAGIRLSVGTHQLSCARARLRTSRRTGGHRRAA